MITHTDRAPCHRVWVVLPKQWKKKKILSTNASIWTTFSFHFHLCQSFWGKLHPLRTLSLTFLSLELKTHFWVSSGWQSKEWADSNLDYCPTAVAFLNHDADKHHGNHWWRLRLKVIPSIEQNDTRWNEIKIPYLNLAVHSQIMVNSQHNHFYYVQSLKIVFSFVLKSLKTSLLSDKTSKCLSATYREKVCTPVSVLCLITEKKSYP